MQRRPGARMCWNDTDTCCDSEQCPWRLAVVEIVIVVVTIVRRRDNIRVSSGGIRFRAERFSRRVPLAVGHAAGSLGMVSSAARRLHLTVASNHLRARPRRLRMQQQNYSQNGAEFFQEADVHFSCRVSIGRYEA